MNEPLDLGQVCDLGQALKGDYTPLDGDVRYRIGDEEMSRHIAVFGPTGGGKSRLLLRILQSLISAFVLGLRRGGGKNRGLLLIDSGDLIDDFLGWLKRYLIDTGETRILPKTHLIELNTQQMARIDTFQRPDLSGIHPEFHAVCMRAWIHTAAQGRLEVLQRKQGQSDFEGMPRAQRVLTNLMTCVATRINGRHLTPADGMLLIDVGHPKHFEVYERLRASLPDAVQADFETLHAFTRPQDVRTETESSLNRWRSLFGPLMAQFTSGTGSEPVLRLHDAVRNGDFILVKAQKTKFTSHDQNMAMSGLMLHDYCEAIMDLERFERNPSLIMIDELPEHLHADIPRYQRILRKYGGPGGGCGMVLGIQDIASLKKKDADYAAAIVGQSNTIISFAQHWPDDVKTISEVIFERNIDFTPQYRDEYQNRGEFEWCAIDEVGRSFQRQESGSTALARGQTETESLQRTESESEQETWGRTNSHSGARSDSTGISTGGSTTRAPLVVGGEIKHHLAVASQSRSDQRSANQSVTTTDGNSDSAGGSRGRSLGISQGHALAQSRTETDTNGWSNGMGISITRKHVPLTKVVHVRTATGELEHKESDQKAQFRTLLASLPTRHAGIRPPQGLGCVIRVAEVPDAWGSPLAQAKAVAALKRELYAIHPYFFTPADEEEEQPRRVAAFLGADAARSAPTAAEESQTFDPMA